jgi:hypothetical protein
MLFLLCKNILNNHKKLNNICLLFDSMNGKPIFNRGCNLTNILNFNTFSNYQLINITKNELLYNSSGSIEIREGKINI